MYKTLFYFYFSPDKVGYFVLAHDMTRETLADED